MNYEQQMAHMTTRLLVTKADGLHYGTGFFVGYDIGNGQSKIYCFTNRHVLQGATICTLPITVGGSDGNPSYGNKVLIDVTDIAQATVFHPDASIDLAAFPVHGIVNSVAANGHTPFLKVINRKDIPKADSFATLGLAEDIVMIGYPNGLSDETNNMPILRRGITATTPSLKFGGKDEFVIDCACFPGSSGSPVFLHQPLGYKTSNGDFMMGSGRSVLIGVLFAGPQIGINGEIVPQVIPTAGGLSIKSLAMMHLGYCIRSTALSFVDAQIGVPFDI